MHGTSISNRDNPHQHDDIDRSQEIPTKLLRNSLKLVHNTLAKTGFVGKIEPLPAFREVIKLRTHQFYTYKPVTCQFKLNDYHPN